MKSKSMKSNNPLKSMIQTDIVKAHGGEISAKSRLSVGANFEIIIPIKSA